MQVYTGEFFKDPSPDFEPAADDNYCGFGMRVTPEETIGFGKPVNVPAIHSTHNDYWDIPPVKCVSVFVIVSTVTLTLDYLLQS